MGLAASQGYGSQAGTVLLRCMAKLSARLTESLSEKASVSDDLIWKDMCTI